MEPIVNLLILCAYQFKIPFWLLSLFGLFAFDTARRAYIQLLSLQLMNFMYVWLAFGGSLQAHHAFFMDRYDVNHICVTWKFIFNCSFWTSMPSQPQWTSIGYSHNLLDSEFRMETKPKGGKRIRFIMLPQLLDMISSSSHVRLNDPHKSSVLPRNHFLGSIDVFRYLPRIVRFYLTHFIWTKFLLIRHNAIVDGA